MHHIVGSLLTRGPGLTIIEGTAVTRNGRVCREDSGLWSDDQIEPLRQVVEFAHSQGQKIGIQLAHAGRKGCQSVLWLGGDELLPEELGGWPNDLWAPSAIQYGPGYAMPNALTTGGIKDIVKAFVDAARRAVKAGVDVIEIHNAHGYLLHEFVSPITNKRTDEYGGSFENRIRLTLEIVDALRAIVPHGMPLFVRYAFKQLIITFLRLTRC